MTLTLLHLLLLSLCETVIYEIPYCKVCMKY